MARRPLPRRRLVLGALAGMTVAAVPAGCTTWPTPTVPMRVRHIASRCRPDRRCVLLPGIYSRADDFVSEGFVEALQRSAPACEMLLADAHLGYFVEGQLLRRLREDVLRPPPAVAGATGLPSAGAGHARPWLVGVSLGGLAALAYAMRHGDEIAGVLAIAPYLGQRTLLRDISAAGGPLAWSRSTPPAAAEAEPYEVIEADVWRWLARRSVEGAQGAGREPPIHLGFGRDDRFADAQRVLQAMLPADHTDIVDGGHDWPPWRALWQRWLQRGLLGRPDAGCGGTA